MAETKTGKEELARKTIAFLNAVLSRGHKGIIAHHFEQAQQYFPEMNVEEQRKQIAAFAAKHVANTPLLREYHQQLTDSRHLQDIVRWEQWPYGPMEETRRDLPIEGTSIHAGGKLTVNYHTVLDEGWGHGKGKYSVMEDVNLFEVTPLPKKISCRMSHTLTKCIYDENGKLYKKMLLINKEKKSEVALSFDERAEYVRLTSGYNQALGKKDELRSQMKERTFLELSRSMEKASQVLGK